MSWIKRIRTPLIIFVVVGILAAVAWFLFGRGCGGEPELAPGSAQQIPDGYQVAPVLKTPWLPFRENEATEYTREFPAGSKVIHVVTNKGEEVVIGILPDGTVVTQKDSTAEVTVYQKRPSLFALEARPFIGGGLSTGGPTAIAGVDVVRAWRLHAGPGVAASYWPDSREDEADVDVGFIGKLSYNAWRNLDLVAFVGYGTAGKCAGGGFQLSIE